MTKEDDLLAYCLGVLHAIQWRSNTPDVTEITQEAIDALESKGVRAVVPVMPHYLACPCRGLV